MKEDILELPQAQTFLMCDMVLNDQIGKKLSCIGIFDNILFEEFPAQHHGFYLYIAISGGHGVIPFKLKCVNMNTLESADIMQDAWKVVEPTQPIPPLIVPVAPGFNEPGTFCWELTVCKPGHKDNGHVIYSRRFEVKQANLPIKRPKL